MRVFVWVGFFCFVGGWVGGNVYTVSLVSVCCGVVGKALGLV